MCVYIYINRTEEWRRYKRKKERKKEMDAEAGGFVKGCEQGVHNRMSDICQIQITKW